jgi:hypothetical protein
VEALPDSKDSLSSRTDTQKVITMRPSILPAFMLASTSLMSSSFILWMCEWDLPFRSERNCFREVLPAAHDRATDGDPAQNDLEDRRRELAWRQADEGDRALAPHHVNRLSESDIAASVDLAAKRGLADRYERNA